MITGKLIEVFCLDDNKNYGFIAASGYEAMTKMLYTLNLSREDRNTKIEKLRWCWSMVHAGKTYSALI